MYILILFQEPIGRLLYVIAQFLQPVPEESTEDCLASQSDNGAAYLKAKLMDIMNKLCKIDMLSLISMVCLFCYIYFLYMFLSL